MKTSDKIKAMPIPIQLELLNKLLTSHGEVDCLKEGCCGEYYRVDSWVEDDEELENKGNKIYIMMCYDCQDILWIERNPNGNIVKVVNTEEAK